MITSYIEVLPLDIWSLILDCKNYKKSKDITYYMLYCTSKTIKFIISRYDYKYEKRGKHRIEYNIKQYLNYYQKEGEEEKKEFILESDYLFRQSVKNGYLNIMKWFFNDNEKNESVFYFFHKYLVISLLNNQKEVFKWLYDNKNHHYHYNRCIYFEQDKYNHNKEQALLTAAEKGMIDIAKIMIDREEWFKNPTCHNDTYRLKSLSDTLLAKSVKTLDISVIEFFNWLYLKYNNEYNPQRVISYMLQNTCSTKDNHDTINNTNVLNVIKWIIPDNNTERLQILDCCIHNLLRLSLKTGNKAVFMSLWNRRGDSNYYDKELDYFFIDILKYITVDVLDMLKPCFDDKEIIRRDDRWITYLTSDETTVKKCNELEWLISHNYGSSLLYKGCCYSTLTRLIKYIILYNRQYINILYMLYDNDEYRKKIQTLKTKHKESIIKEYNDKSEAFDNILRKLHVINT